MAWKPDYVTLSQMKHFLNIDDDDTADDAEISRAITTASRAVDNCTHRQFGKVDAAEERIYPAVYDRDTRRWLVEMDDLMVTTSLTAIVVIDGSNAGSIDYYVLEPRNASQQGRPWTVLSVEPRAAFLPSSSPREVAITGIWGWTAVPAAVEEATILQASRFNFRRVSPHGVAGSPTTGSEIRLQERLDVDVATSLGDYTRWWKAP